MEVSVSLNKIVIFSQHVAQTLLRKWLFVCPRTKIKEIRRKMESALPYDRDNVRFSIRPILTKLDDNSNE